MSLRQTTRTLSVCGGVVGGRTLKRITVAAALASNQKSVGRNDNGCTVIGANDSILFRKRTVKCEMATPRRHFFPIAFVVVNILSVVQQQRERAFLRLVARGGCSLGWLDGQARADGMLCRYSRNLV